jgi:Fur family peroxide stress response transcriptional regulator
MEFFRRRCAECGLARTHQRDVLYRALAESEDHPSPEEVYEKVRKEIPAISLATVYRNIKIFKDCGLLQEVRPLQEPSRLDANLAHHHHLVCLRCGSILDLHGEDLEPVRFRKRFPKGFQVERYEVEVLGICSRCAARAARAGAAKSITQPKEKTPWEK